MLDGKRHINGHITDVTARETAHNLKNNGNLEVPEEYIQLETIKETLFGFLTDRAP